MSDTVLSRFLRYVQIDTQSDERSQTYPSTPGQLELLKLLRAELETLGAAEVTMSPHGYVMATVPGTLNSKRLPTIAFLAHVDTSPDCSGKGVKPVVHPRYQGKDIRFRENPDLVLSPGTSPELLQARGKDIVTASGTTLLGADDKAGVAAIMTAVECLLRADGLKHGPVRVCFTPDEEIGRGVQKLNLEELGADFAYTLDGGSPGELCWETFSADGAEVTIQGIPTHTMEAKAKGMVNAVHLAGKLLAALPRERLAPETTAGREGFIHPLRLEGKVEACRIDFILRDFELEGLAAKRKILDGICRGLQTAEPRAKVRCRFRKQYRNMAQWLRQDMRPVELAREAIRAVGLKPYDHVIRGGTDGSRLTEMGLPTPNLFCGEHNAHGPLEWVAAQDMELAVKTCVELVQAAARKAARGRR